MCGEFSKISAKYIGKKGPLSIVNNVPMQTSYTEVHFKYRICYL